MDKPVPSSGKRKPLAKGPPAKKRATTPRKKSAGGNTAFLLLFTAIFSAVAVYSQMKKAGGLQYGSEAAQGEYVFDLKGYNEGARYPHYDLPPGVPVLHVFFIGNSYTIVNNLPFMLAAVAASDTVSPVDIEPGMFAKGGVTLARLWPDESGHSTLNSRRWDYVVLQDMSVLPSSLPGEGEMYEGITKWNAEIKTTGAKTVVYETWARKPGTDWYDHSKHPDINLVSPEVMQDKVHAVTNNIAGDIGAMIIPAGDYWAVCRDQPGMPDLYHADGTHPSLAGTYLVALLFYRALTGHAPGGVSYVPPGVSPAQAQMLKKCASYGS